jgi:Flp pilus assembly protein TadB
MAKERARRRAEREAAAQARREATEAAAARRARRAERAERLRSALIPAALRRRRGRVGRWRTRHSSAQRAVVYSVAAVAAVLLWFLVESWPLRIALSVLALVAFPVVLTLVFGRTAR